MVNQERVRMMTRLSVYEESKGKTMFPTGEYYRGDYIARQMIFSFFLGTIAFVLLFLLFIGNQMDGLMDRLVGLDLTSMLVMILVLYAIFMVIYLGVTYAVTSYQYKKNRKSLKAYEKALNTLEGQMQKEESDTKALF